MVPSENLRALSPKEQPTKWENIIHGAMEMVTLLMVFFSPWAFGAVHPFFEMILYWGVATTVGLWALKILSTREFCWTPDFFLFCLVGLLLVACIQMVSWPEAVLEYVSPRTGGIYDRFLSVRDNPGINNFAQWGSVPGTTISLSPGATRWTLLRILAVVLFYASIANTFATKRSFRRLAILCTFQGAGLAMFAILQFLSARPSFVYWSWETAGRCYGPFVCRNHFPFYVNICVGLAIGLFFSRIWKSTRHPESTSSYPTQGIVDLLRTPECLWILAGVILMVGSNFLSLSRGGMVAFLIAISLGIFLQWRVLGKSFSGGLWFLGVFLVFGFLSWVGLQQIEHRIDTLWQADTLQQSRFYIWQRVWPRVSEFPIWGSGFGTFLHMDQMSRHPGDDSTLFVEFAHNEYLHVLVEGGCLSLLFVLLAVGYLLRTGYIGYKKSPFDSTGNLVLGGLLGLTTVVVHSWVDFGLHIPAIVVLVTVVSAHITACSSKVSRASEKGKLETGERGAGKVRHSGMIVVIPVLLLMGMSVLLVVEGWRLSQAERFRLAARNLGEDATLTELEKRIDYLQAAVSLKPRDVELRLALATALAQTYEVSLDRARQRVEPVRVASLVGNTGAIGSVNDGLMTFEFLSRLVACESWNQEPKLRVPMDSMRKQFIYPALKQYRSAKDLCPIHHKPYVGLATFAEEFSGVGSREDNLGRAVELRPTDVRLWYLLGEAQLKAKNFDGAWFSWSNSLRCSKKHLRPIVQRSLEKLAPSEVAQKVIPFIPHVLWDAGNHAQRFLGTEEVPREFLTRALEGLAQRKVLGGGDYELKGKLHEELKQPQLAVEAYRFALVFDPENLDLRFLLARALAGSGEFNLALQQIQVVMDSNSKRRHKARELYDELSEKVQGLEHRPGD